ncbi:MAG: YihY/virulence factor BrkB family protein [Deltaproteobacteria bacterium]|nr:YihY/virulence factor BrkB family protein [Deltaproteobacteria bacterium]MBW2069853.1 YihY/virulence factor BrkB family protein [Deltaproteobacteria bacterium]
MVLAEQLSKRAQRLLWSADLDTLPWWHSRLLKICRLGYVVARDILEGQITLRAMSLVYTTLLALVPLLAVSFAILKGFGVHNQIEPLLLNFLKPLGEKGVEISNRIIGFVDNIKAGVLGSLGLALLIYTVISLIQKIERAFNHTWRVKKTRSMLQRFSDYLSVIAIGPLLVFAAIGLTASFMSTTIVRKLMTIEPLGTLLVTSTELLPYLFIIAAFTFVYLFVPNTKVRLRSAIVGAVTAGVLWQGTGWLFASFVVKSTKYTAIYSGFAILIMFMIWLYLSWLILLVGAAVAFYHQHPESLSPYHGEIKLSPRLQQKLSLLIMLLIARNYYERKSPWTADQLASHLSLTTAAVESILESLQEHGLLTQTGSEPCCYLPAQPLETVGLKDVLDAAAAGGENSYSHLQTLVAEEAVERIVDRIDRAVEEALKDYSIKKLLFANDPMGSAVAAATGPQPPVCARHQHEDVETN